MNFCVVPSLQPLQAVIWGAGRILQLAQLLLPEHGSKQGTRCQLQHLLTGSRARHNGGIFVPSLAKNSLIYICHKAEVLLVLVLLIISVHLMP